MYAYDNKTIKMAQYFYHHNQDKLTAEIFFYQKSLSAITLGKSFTQDLVFTQSWWIKGFAGQSNQHPGQH